MSEFMVKLRYYPGDPLEQIRREDLAEVAGKFGVALSYDKIENRELKSGLWMENTLEKQIEDITQEVITVSGKQQESFSECIRCLYKKYRCPRTPYSLLGSNEAGRKIAWGLMNTYGGW